MTKPYVHRRNCTGCPECDPACRRLLTMSPAELGEFYEARNRTLGAGGANRVLRVASAGTIRTTGAAPACRCGGKTKPTKPAAAVGPVKDRVTKLAALKRTTTGRRISEAALRTLSDDQLVGVLAEAVLFDRQLLAPPCTYNLDASPRAAAADNWSLTDPGDSYDLAGLERQRLAALRREVAA